MVPELQHLDEMTSEPDKNTEDQIKLQVNSGALSISIYLGVDKSLAYRGCYEKILVLGLNRGLFS